MHVVGFLMEQLIYYLDRPIPLFPKFNNTIEPASEDALAGNLEKLVLETFLNTFFFLCLNACFMTQSTFSVKSE